MEEAVDRLQDFYHMLKIHALSGNGGDPLWISTKEIQGLLRCYLQCVEAILEAMQVER